MECASKEGVTVTRTKIAAIIIARMSRLIIVSTAFWDGVAELEGAEEVEAAEKVEAALWFADWAG